MARYAAIAAWASDQRLAGSARRDAQPERKETPVGRATRPRILRIALQVFSARS